MAKNEIKVLGDYAEVILRNRQREIVAITLIDAKDVEKVSLYAWSYNKTNGYVQNTRSYHEGKGRYLHQFVFGVKQGFDIDHINEDKLDNQKNNLRHLTRSQNKLNVKKNKGVCWDKSRNKWMAYIKIGSVKKHLGRFETYEEAIETREKAKKAVFECLK